MNGKDKSEQKKNEDFGHLNRRTALKQIMGLPVLGGLSAGFGASFSLEEGCLLAQSETGNNEKTATDKVDAVSGATRTSWEMPDTSTLKSNITKAKIGPLEVSRLILGGNLIGGWAHSRDLVYVSELIKRYHTKEKVFQTFQIAEQCGINTFMGNPIMNEMMSEYWRWTDGGGGGHTIVENIQIAIDFGCDACYIHGGIADRLVADKDFDTIARCFEVMRDNGLPAGLGGHYQSTVQGIVDEGLIPDFWMKTFHHTKYWSAQNPTEHDNIFCREPDETRAFMQERPEPWIAFKTLGAGAILPAEGFKFAWEGGADFVCVGMYDFQIIDDANIWNEVQNAPSQRKRRILETVTENEEPAAEEA